MKAGRRSRFHLAVLAAGAAVAAVTAGPASAADNVPGKYYENRLIGFRFRPLNEWAEVPPGTDPTDPKLCGFYSDKARFDSGLRPECSVYAFKAPRGERVATPASNGGGGLGDGGGEDPGEKPSPEDEIRERLMDQFRDKSIRQVLERARERYTEMGKFILEQVERRDPKKAKKMKEDLKLKDPVERVVKGKEDEPDLTVLEAMVGVPMTNGEIHGARLVAGFVRNDEYEAGAVYEIPEAVWKKYGQGVYSSLRSLEFLSGPEIAAARKDLAEALEGKTGDERWLEEIKRKVSPGWAHLQTKNYLLVYDKAVKPDRVKLIAIQIEAIRKDVYEVLFPPDRPITAISVVRVCKDRDQYGAYGGPGGSAGYWNSGAQELVFYEDVSAKKDSLRVLNHEAFHQYIFYSVGSISPHDWFNEGHGDYFAGHDYSNTGKFVAKPFSWRVSEIKTAMGSKKFVPLKIFMDYSHAQYYGPQIGQNYAQGWSVIWFLRRTRNPEWKTIAETYFRTLKGEVTTWVEGEIAKAKEAGTWKEGWRPDFTPDNVEAAARKKAFESVFGGWDDRKWARFEKDWLDFKYN